VEVKSRFARAGRDAGQVQIPFHATLKLLEKVGKFLIPHGAAIIGNYSRQFLMFLAAGVPARIPVSNPRLGPQRFS
jgi:hypothetical protein